MLLSLSVTHFTLVEALEVDFESGMTALTGETGAGKSLVLDALALALGGRADTTRIRSGSDKAEVSAQFDLAGIQQAQQWLEQQDFTLENSENAAESTIENTQEQLPTTCLLRRVITRTGRSKGYINGQAATMQQLRQLGEMLIDIHSQHEHQSLLRRETQQQLLDNFAGTSTLAEQVHQHYRHWSSLNNKLQQLMSQADEQNARLDLLQFQVQELDELALAEGELDTLEQQQLTLSNAESIMTDSQSLLTLCQDAEGFNVQEGLNRCLQILNNMASKPPLLSEASDLLNSALIEVQEAGANIQRHVDQFEADPEQLASVEARLSEVFQLARKHRIQPEELPSRHAQLTAELQQLSDPEANLEALQQQLNAAHGEYSALATRLSEKRQVAATDISQRVTQQFSSLAMEGATFTVELTPTIDNEAHQSEYNASTKVSLPHPNGFESANFLIATNPGATPGALKQVASGGELSRISLAIQVIAAQHTAIPVLVFDEVDVGIGGATADVVGKMLRQLGQKGQVICVTHQPQVASRAHHQLQVTKTTSAASAESDIQPLDATGRVDEIARMLGGADITDTTRHHAQEMLQLGSAE